MPAYEVDGVLRFLDGVNDKFLMPIELPDPITTIQTFNNIISSALREGDKLVRDSVQCLLPIFFPLKELDVDRWVVDLDAIPFVISDWASEIQEAGIIETALTTYDFVENKKSRLTKIWLDVMNGRFCDCNLVLQSDDDKNYVTFPGIEESGVIRFNVNSVTRSRTLQDIDGFVSRFGDVRLAADEYAKIKIAELHETINCFDFRCTNADECEILRTIARPLMHHIPYLIGSGYALYFIFAPAAAKYNNNVIHKLFSLGGLFILLKGHEGGMLFKPKSAEESIFISKCRALINKLSSSIVAYYYRKQSLANATKAAIGSIMSRNGSHNIGSHVLAALSHNVGTMPDDRLLYQYIQHRMDYIATATTDFPSWSGETKLVNGLIRRFLSQRHLLDHIAGSEGLHAFKFQDPNVSGKARREQTDTIKLHIRRRDEKGSIISDFITEDNETNGKSVVEKLKNDISVAMPGGVIGAHAFFTILENVIRNAAKHGWARQKDDKQNQDAKAENLDIYVDFILDNDGKSITVIIFDNISDVFSVFDDGKMTEEEKRWLNKYRDKLKHDKENNLLKGEWEAVVEFLVGRVNADSLPVAYKEQYKILSSRTPEELKDIADRLMGEVPSDGSIGNRLWLPLHHSQDIKLRQSFIDDAGTLRRENWGLAEMKISAGYLNKRSISDIGGITQGLPIVTPVCVEQQETFKDKDNKEVRVWKNHLGYQFKIPRPREIAFVCDQTNISQAKIDQLQTLGIFVTPLPEEMKFFKPKNEGDNDWNYSYVVLPSFPEQENPHLPFRVLVKDKSGCKCPDMVPDAVFYDTIVARLQSEESAETIAESLKKDVYRTWMDYWCKKRGFGAVDCSTRPPLRIMPTEVSDSGRSNQGLVSNYEVWDFVFKEMFRSIVGDLLQKADAGEFLVAEDVYWYLAILAVMPKSLGENSSVFTFKDEDNALRAKINDDKNPIDNLGRELIFNQLSKWFSEFESINNSSDRSDSLLVGMLPFAKNYSLKLRGLNLSAMSGDEIKHRIVSVARTMQEIVSDCVAISYFEFKPGNKLYVHEGNKANGMIRFVNNMCSAYREADVMLRKYEERIVSLPAFLSESQGNKDKESRGKEEHDRIEIERDFERRLKEGDGGGISLYYGKTSTNWDGRAIVFQRHAKPVDYNYERMLYFEPLSGTQSYLYELMQLPQSDSADQILTRMYETGLSRVLIVDERVSKFLRSRPDEIKTFCRMGIWCVDEAKFGVAKKVDNKEKVPPIEMLDSLIEFDKEKFDKYAMIFMIAFMATLILSFATKYY